MPYIESCHLCAHEYTCEKRGIAETALRAIRRAGDGNMDFRVDDGVEIATVIRCLNAAP